MTRFFNLLGGGDDDDDTLVIILFLCCFVSLIIGGFIYFNSKSNNSLINKISNPTIKKLVVDANIALQPIAKAVGIPPASYLPTNSPAADSPAGNSPAADSPAGNSPAGNSPPNSSVQKKAGTPNKSNKTNNDNNNEFRETVAKTVVLLGVSIVSGIALEKMGEKIDKLLFRKAVQSIAEKRLLASTKFYGPFKSTLAKGARYASSAFKFGPILSANLAAKGTQEFAKKGLVAAVATGKATAKVATMLGTGAALGPVGIGLMVFQGLTLALDVGDPGNYNLLDTWKGLKKELEKESSPPTIVGPLDSMQLTPDLTVSQTVTSADVIISDVDGSVTILPNPSVYLSKFLPPFLKLMNEDADFNGFMGSLGPDADISAQVDYFMNKIKPGTSTSYSDYWSGLANKEICTSNMGTFLPDGTCMYTKEGCNAELKPHDVGRVWDTVTNTCVSINATMEGIAQSQGMVYNPHTGLPDITVNMCLGKAGDPEPKDPGDAFCTKCEVSVGLQICGAIFGDTICKGFDQLFNLNQYNPCGAEESDLGLMCIRCKGDDYAGGICYGGCDVGWNYEGVDTNLAKNKSMCVKDCNKYNDDSGKPMKNNGSGICVATECPPDYEPAVKTAGNLTCNPKTYTVSGYPVKYKLDYEPGNTYSPWRCDADWNYDEAHQQQLWRIEGDDLAKFWDQSCSRECDSYNNCHSIGCERRCRRDKKPDSCNEGYTRDLIGWCRSNNKNAYCNAQDQMSGLMCYPQCRDGYSMKTAGICTAGDVKSLKQITPERKVSNKSHVPTSYWKKRKVPLSKK
jgi:hypothetical protein